MKVTVIIISYNGKQFLKRCLESTLSSDIKVEVVVIDNASTDNSHEIIRSFPKVTLIGNNENLGFGRANNIGIAYVMKNSKPDYFFLLNQDAYLQPDTIREMISIHQQNPVYGVLSPLHLNGRGEGLDNNFRNYISRNENILYDSLFKEKLDLVYDVPFVNAAGWLVPTTTFEKIGGFDPIFYHYGEDVNFCQRILFHGLRIGITPKALLLHDREDRKTDQVLFVESSLQELEKKWKVRFADISENSQLKIKNEKKKLKRSILKSLIVLKLKRVALNMNKLILLNKIQPEIENSRTLNIMGGKNYL